MHTVSSLPDRFREYFPETIFELGRVGQLEKIAEELLEALEAARDDQKFLVEVVDVIQASFTALYKAGYTDSQIREAIAGMQQKNGRRGYYSRK